MQRELDVTLHNLTELPALANDLEILHRGYNNLSSLPLLPSSLRELICINNNLPEWYYTSTIKEIRERQIQEIIDRIKLL